MYASQWEQYSTRNGVPGNTPPDIEGHSEFLEDLKFSRTDEGSIDLRGLQMPNLALGHLKIRPMDFSRSVLPAAMLGGCEFIGDDKNHTRFKGAHIKGGKLQRATFNSVDFSEDGEERTILDRANLSDSVFEFCNFGRASMFGAEAPRAKFKFCEFDLTDNPELLTVDFTGARVEGCKFVYKDRPVEGIVLEKGRITCPDLSVRARTGEFRLVGEAKPSFGNSVQAIDVVPGLLMEGLERPEFSELLEYHPLTRHLPQIIVASHSSAPEELELKDG